MNNYFRRSLDGTVDLIAEQLKQLDGQEVTVKPPAASCCPYRHLVEIILAVANSCRPFSYLVDFLDRRL